MQNRRLSWRVRVSLVAGLMLVSFLSQAAIQDFKGNPTTLQEHIVKGKWTVVLFWASDCHVCNQEAHSYVDFHFMNSDEKAEILGFSVDGKEKLQEAKKFIQRHRLNFPNIIGEFSEIAKIYAELTGAPFVGTPSVMVFDPEGVLKAAQVGAVPTSIIEEFIESQTVAVVEQ